jgi:hypothetical protein
MVKFRVDEKINHGASVQFGLLQRQSRKACGGAVFTRAVYYEARRAAHKRRRGDGLYQFPLERVWKGRIAEDDVKRLLVFGPLDVQFDRHEATVDSYRGYGDVLKQGFAFEGVFFDSFDRRGPARGGFERDDARAAEEVQEGTGGKVS